MYITDRVREYLKRRKNKKSPILRQFSPPPPTEEEKLRAMPPTVKIGPDPLFLVLAVILLLLGTVLSFSASTAYAENEYGNSFHFLEERLRHIAFVIPVAIAVMLFLTPYNAPYVAVVSYIASIILLLAVLAIGITGGGAQRWLDLKVITLQPSEVAKTAIILFMAKYMSDNEDKIISRRPNRKSFVHGFIHPGLIFGLVCILVVFEKHFSGLVIIGIIGLVMMFIGGTNIWYLSSLLPLGGIIFGVMMLTPYSRARIDSWLSPGADASGGDYQTLQGLAAIGSGGLFGLGLGESRLKYGYVPQLQNDFVFTIVCEEIGFFGALAILLLFLALTARGFILASRAPNKFTSLVIFGLTFKVALHVLLNVGVVSGLLPNTGISLPFFSTGGSATLMQIIEISIILALSRYCTQKR